MRFRRAHGQIIAWVVESSPACTQPPIGTITLPVPHTHHPHRGRPTHPFATRWRPGTTSKIDDSSLSLVCSQMVKPTIFRSEKHATTLARHFNGTMHMKSSVADDVFLGNFSLFGHCTQFSLALHTGIR